MWMVPLIVREVVMKLFKGTAVAKLIAVKREILSPTQFIELSRSRPAGIKRATYVIPTIGKPGFGAFEVEYHTARLVHEK